MEGWAGKGCYSLLQSVILSLSLPSSVSILWPLSMCHYLHISLTLLHLVYVLFIDLENIHTHPYTHTHTHAHTHTHTPVSAYAVESSVRPSNEVNRGQYRTQHHQQPTHTHAGTHRHTHTHEHAEIYTHTHTHTHPHTHTHTPRGT